jgi:hypothetical protein
VEIRQPDGLAVHTIQVGRLDHGVAVRVDIAVSLVISDDEYDVWFRLGMKVARQQDRKRWQSSKYHVISCFLWTVLLKAALRPQPGRYVGETLTHPATTPTSSRGAEKS